MNASETAAPAWRRPTRQQSWLILGAVLLAVVVCVVAYSAGQANRAHTYELHGTAHVGDHEASIRVDGWSYGIPGSVAWTDSAGVLHDGGWPACLAPIGSRVPIEFQAVSLSTPDQRTLRPVTWVNCRS